jgi:arylsulfatase
MLFDLVEDPAELVDLAAQQPDIVARLVAEFEADASANCVYPLDNRDDLRAITVPPYELAGQSAPRDFLPGAQWVPGTVVSPLIADRSYTLSAHFDWRPGQEGVLLALGDRFCGMSLFVIDGALHFVYQWWFSPAELQPVALEPGAQEFVLGYTALGQRRGQGRASLNGMTIHGAAELSPTMVRLPSGGLTVGLNRRQAISARYAGRGSFRYTGRIERVRIEPGPQAPDTPMVIDEAAVQARMRAGR